MGRGGKRRFGQGKGEGEEVLVLVRRENFFASAMSCKKKKKNVDTSIVFSHVQISQVAFNGFLISWTIKLSLYCSTQMSDF